MLASEPANRAVSEAAVYGIDDAQIHAALL